MTTGHTVFSESTYLGRCGVNLGLGTGNFTVELWVQIPEGFVSTSAISLFSYNQGNTDNELLVLNRDLDSPGPKMGLFVQGSEVTTPSSSVWDLADGAWHHLAVTRAKNAGCTLPAKCCTASFHKDGALVHTTENFTCEAIRDGGCVVLGQEQTTECGGFDSPQEFVGNMTEVRLWNTSRSLSQIQAQMVERINSSLPVPQDLVAVWPLDCRHYFDDFAGGADLTGCYPGSGMAAMATIDGKPCPCNFTHECFLDTHNCDAHATCHNTETSFECSCDWGWEGDGVASCTLIPPFQAGHCPTGNAPSPTCSITPQLSTVILQPDTRAVCTEN